MANSLVSSVRGVPPPRLVGWATIAAGTLGVLALGALVLALQSRATDAVINPEANRIVELPRVAMRAHDLGSVLQAFLMIPAVLFLSPLAGADHGKTGRLTALGLIGETTVALSLLLTFVSNASDMLYMMPQGLVGLWLILVSFGTRHTLRGTAWIGIVAGTGLVIIALSSIGIAVAIGPVAAVLKPAAAPPVDPAAISGATNRVAHLALAAGTLLGRTLYPLWAISLGIRLLSGRAVDIRGGAPAGSFGGA